MINSNHRYFGEIQIMTSDNVITKDIKKLHETFYRYFDRSKAESILRSFEKSPDTIRINGGEFIGSGSFCSAYRVSFSRNSDYHHVLSIAHINFHESLEAERSLKQWVKRMRTLSGISNEAIPLIPPFSCLLGTQTVAWVTPFAEGEEQHAKAHWFPISEQIKKMQNQLRKNRLLIEDHLQIRTWQGIPFIHDLSDLINILPKKKPA